MASNYTPNYQLSQWERADKVLMEDFNEDNAKIDAALKAGTDARAELSAALGQKADQTALSGLQSAINALQTAVAGKQDSSGALRLAVGSYAGRATNLSATTSQTISLPFVPKAVFVIPQNGAIYNSNISGYVYGGLAVTGHPGKHNGCTTLEISGQGFRVYTYCDDRSTFIRLNDSGETYHYLALG